MKLLEIKNNLAKLSYEAGETPVLGRFIVLVSTDISYVAQLVNLKSDTVNNFVIAKLIFTFTSEGVVENYDGSIPSIASEVSNLPASELLNLLPIETPIKLGNLAQLEDMLAIDISVFERNLTVFAQKDSHKKTFISNCIRQLFQMKEKSVIVDTDNLFEDYEKIRLGIDYKLPLNSQMIDYIFDYELSEVDAATKAVIQDIFYAVQQYINSLETKFLPIDNFVDVVTNQYKELQMPELALLKNKLLKYRDANIFANTKEEVDALKEHLNRKNCSIIDLKDIHESLQKQVLSILHSILETFDKYVYLFVPITDENSDKKLLKQFINHNHVFTTIITSSSYKYADELKQHAQNIILFAPDSINNDFAAYNTFLNKLNQDECIVCGKLTQGIPFIIEMNDIETDLTQDDVLGDKYQFIPVTEELQLVKNDGFGNQIPVSLNSTLLEETSPETVISTEIENIEEYPDETIIDEVLVEEENSPESINQEEDEIYEEEIAESSIIEPVANLLEEDSPEDNSVEIEGEDLLTESQEDLDFDNNPVNQNLTEDDLDFMDNNAQLSDDNDIVSEEAQDLVDFPSSELHYEGVKPPVVPIYPAEDSNSESSDVPTITQGDTVTHPRYGRGVVEKIIKYGNKTLCSISFENIGRRLLDPTISELTKI